MANETDQEKLEKKRAAARRRKRKSRAKLKAEREALVEKQGIAKVELELPVTDWDRLDAMRQARAVVGEPYSREEYIAELIQQDENRYQEQVAALGCCGKCKSPLPQGCEGVFEGDSECWRTRKFRELML
ncbi:hypothetical protein [Vibrio campbellii]|uniref:hypothetical protein n=1 Tax=Vibrio campbellii TaxID=680 RepID=UPI00210B04DD|nr:hypothetical protein [Vibrio campbellii]UTZ44662.1 hypothetical protein HB764_25725 [Vibrio campbellii]